MQRGRDALCQTPVLFRSFRRWNRRGFYFRRQCRAQFARGATAFAAIESRFERVVARRQRSLPARGNFTLAAAEQLRARQRSARDESAPQDDKIEAAAKRKVLFTEVEL